MIDKERIRRGLVKCLEQLRRNKTSEVLPKAEILKVGFIVNNPDYKCIYEWEFSCQGYKYVSNMLNADLNSSYMGYTYDELEEISRQFWSGGSRVK